jgi:hypothetical protein
MSFSSVVFVFEFVLVSVYHAVALRFCELHDTPGRMLEKGAISAVVPWKSSRRFFGARLRRRLAEARVGKARLAVKTAEESKAKQKN